MSRKFSTHSSPIHAIIGSCYLLKVLKTKKIQAKFRKIGKSHDQEM